MTSKKRSSIPMRMLSSLSIVGVHCDCSSAKKDTPREISNSSSMEEYSSSSSASAAHEVAANSDLLIEILIHLPIVSLMQFKSVSKSWLSVITSDIFALRRNPDSTAVSGLLLHRFTGNMIPKLDFIPLINTTKSQTDNPHPQFLDLPFFPGFSGNIRIIGSCHGLLLCCFGRTENNSSKPDYVILNPTTKQFKILPKCHLSDDLRGLTLAFDPSKSPHYKVACLHFTGSVSMSYGGGHNQIIMYSSETGSWKASGAPFAAQSREHYHVGLYWNGAINWFSKWGYRDSVYYKVDEERLGIIPLLPIPGFSSYLSHPHNRVYGESRGHLHLVQCTTRWPQLDVFEIERDYSRWFLIHSVDPLAVGVPRDPYGMFDALCVVRMERDEEPFLVLHIPGKILLYSFGDRTLKKVCDVAVETGNENSMQYFWCSSYQYIESLSGV